MCAAIALVLSLAPAIAHADEEGRTRSTFRYVHPARKHYVRAALEISAILVAGYAQYRSEAANSRDWELGYDWDSFRKKLTGSAVTFDTNHFDTNMLTHPLSGTLYYQAARGNRLDIAEAASYALGASAVWEYVGEIREKVSINDMIVTPIAGIAIGETFTQLGAYFDRGNGNALTSTFAMLFGTSKAVHDRIDGAEPVHAEETDELGLSEEGEHAIAITAGTASTLDSAARSARVDANIGVRTHLMNIPEYRHATRTSRFVTDGNVSKLAVDTTFGKDGLSDLLLFTQSAPIGWYEQSLVETGDGALRGQRVFVGMTMGFDYALHRYDRTRSAASDAISTVHAGGLTLESTGLLGGLDVTSTLDAHASFAAVHSYARDAFLERGGKIDTLPAVTQNEGYYFALGATVAPSVELRAHRWSVGAEARVDGFWGLEGLDRGRRTEPQEASLYDWRASAKGTIGFAPAKHILLSLAFIQRLRGGRMNDVAMSQRESTVLSSIAFVF